MAGYDPQKGGARPRPEPTDPSPLDELLGDSPAPETTPADDGVVSRSEPLAARVEPEPAPDSAISEYGTYGVAALLALVLLFLLRRRK